MTATDRGAWERRGECNHCGWCCQFLAIVRLTSNAPVIPDEERFYGLRGGVRREDGRMCFVAHYFMPCEIHDNEGKRCREYDARPEICKAFPTTPEQIEGTPCSHWFESTSVDGSVERRGGLDSPHPTPPRFSVPVRRE